MSTPENHRRTERQTGENAGAWWRGLGLILVGLLGLWLVAKYPPSNNPYFPKCFSYQITGLHCPGCGTTRALNAALNGDIRQAFAYNLLFVLTIPLLMYHLIDIAVWNLVKRRLPRLVSARWSSPLILLLVVIMISFGILRNIPTQPFTLLAPHELNIEP